MKNNYEEDDDYIMVDDETERLTQICATVDKLTQILTELDAMEYERVQQYISSRYGIDLPITQPE